MRECVCVRDRAPALCPYVVHRHCSCSLMGCGGNSYAFSKVSQATLADGRLAIEILQRKDKSRAFWRTNASFEDAHAG